MVAAPISGLSAITPALLTSRVTSAHREQRGRGHLIRVGNVERNRNARTGHLGRVPGARVDGGRAALGQFLDVGTAEAAAGPGDQRH